jgi:YVTN family beta-propeller protein
VTVINSLDNTVTSTIILPAGSRGARGVTVLGSNVYVANYRSHNVSVINTADNTVTATIAVGNGPRGLAAVGTNIYVENFDDGTISVINTLNNSVITTIDAAIRRPVWGSPVQIFIFPVSRMGKSLFLIR